MIGACSPKVSIISASNTHSVWARLAKGARNLGKIISFAFGRIAKGAQNVVNWIVQAHNTLNDIPGAAALPGISGKDIKAPSVSDISAGKGGGPGGAGGRTQGGDTHITNNVTVEGGSSSAMIAWRIYEQMERECRRRQSKTLYGSGGLTRMSENPDRDDPIPEVTLDACIEAFEAGEMETIDDSKGLYRLYGDLHRIDGDVGFELVCAVQRSDVVSPQFSDEDS